MEGLKKFMGGFQPPSSPTFQRPYDVVNHYAVPTDVTVLWSWELQSVLSDVACIAKFVTI